ncbi:MAG TPA: zinc ribbon domain-containing protein [Chloroflexus aurantiacus]|jgi:putative FmdB family regulatory protein|uniref:Regulatory protein, FmdB family n=1 Tax=Chloroflexus aurantiacus (strain ATCC 29366 / DSM 635 / J-10-fl) TaxID=324602 RepID=A9WE61_CHLAA|nr:MULTISPECIES: zinc ribbon domain-containing protein [Chloroflexus]ABY33721.1 regulatory protein, FmdB family [Chloroflexus aurantiacus J-10-fl]RMG49693.1 MAG: zinc ribbon domain-containing protein [Chloroflexota bacterium]GIV94345.1 MAG: FmdB family transcriptional regulator [Chloroflexus sp.]HBW68168.1 zinc ribbon domain-containing protein [Chloroflexus aurantiacus]
MPIYEYLCPACNGQFQKLVRGFSDPPGLACPRCGNTGVRRAISRFATLKSEEDRLESLADPSTFMGLDESDPRSIARWAKRLGKELGEDAGEDWDEMVDQMLEEELSGKKDDESSSTGKPDDLGWA